MFFLIARIMICKSIPAFANIGWDDGVFRWVGGRIVENDALCSQCGLFTFMNRVYMFLKVSFLSCFVFTLWALELLAFMDWFYVPLKVSFLSKYVDTKSTLKCLTSMNWLYMPQKIASLFCCVVTDWAEIVLLHLHQLRNIHTPNHNV